jgi:hypothetical protein
MMRWALEWRRLEPGVRPAMLRNRLEELMTAVKGGGGHRRRAAILDDRSRGRGRAGGVGGWQRLRPSLAARVVPHAVVEPFLQAAAHVAAACRQVAATAGGRSGVCGWALWSEMKLKARWCAGRRTRR